MIRTKLIALLFCLTASANAAENVQAIAENIQKSKQDVEKEELKKRKVLAALYEINQKMRKAVSDKSKTMNERNALEENIARLNDRLKSLDQTSAKLKARLAERLKMLSRLGGPSVARILLSASSSSQLDRNLKITGLIAAHDRDLIKEYRDVRKEIDLKRVRLAKRSERLEKVAAQLKVREGKLLSEQAFKNRLLDGIRKKKIFAMNNIKELKGKLQDDTILDFLFRPSFADQRGLLKPPVQGTLAKNFGLEKSEEHAWSINHRGIRWKAPQGQPVTAVFDGVVAWTGEIAGLGQAIVIDHGEHYYSVYAETQDLHVIQGQEVQRDQVIANVGRSSWESSPGLHFEIRHFSEADDPKVWMKGTAL